MQTLSDTDPMPFGKYKGKPMQDIPAKYFHWLWISSAKQDMESNVADYIRRNKSALQMEFPDGIW